MFQPIKTFNVKKHTVTFIICLCFFINVQDSTAVIRANRHIIDRIQERIEEQQRRDEQARIEAEQARIAEQQRIEELVRRAEEIRAREERAHQEELRAGIEQQDGEADIDLVKGLELNIKRMLQIVKEVPGIKYQEFMKRMHKGELDDIDDILERMMDTREDYIENSEDYSG